MQIEINISNKKPKAKENYKIVCGNSDYTILFSFDEEWNPYDKKTARFNFTQDGVKKYIDVLFSGNECPMPIMSKTSLVEIGVYAGELRTTTPCILPCEKSILCDNGTHTDPPEDVYSQLLNSIKEPYIGDNGNWFVWNMKTKSFVDSGVNSRGDKGDKGDRGERGADGKDGINGADGKDGYTPQKGVDYFTAQDIKSLGIDDKVDKVDGKGLSTNDFTDALKNKLNNIDDKATSSPKVITVDFEQNSEEWQSWNDKTFFNQYSDGLYYITGGYVQEDSGGGYYESVILLCTNSDDGGPIIDRLLITYSGDMYSNFEYWWEDEDNNVWQKVSVSQRDLTDAIGDVETSLENIIAKYGLGGDGV